MGDLAGVWKHEKNENFDEFLQAMKVGMIPRKMASKQSPTITITQSGDDFTIVTKGARTVEIKFKVGGTYKENSPLEGKDFTMQANWDGKKLVTKNLDKPDGAITMREVEGGKLIVTQKCGDVTCRRIFGKKE